MPEGNQITPPPVEMRPREYVGSKSFLIVVSTVLGIVIGIGMIVGGLGKAFFVERDEWNKQTLAGAEDKAVVNETLKRIDLATSHQEAALDRLTSTVELIKQDIAAMRVRR
jgi:hypothetical protein